MVRPLPSQGHRYQQIKQIKRLLLGVTSNVVGPFTEVARDVEERMRKKSEGMEPRFFSCM